MSRLRRPRLTSNLGGKVVEHWHSHSFVHRGWLMLTAKLNFCDCIVGCQRFTQGSRSAFSRFVVCEQNLPFENWCSCGQTQSDAHQKTLVSWSLCWFSTLHSMMLLLRHQCRYLESFVQAKSLQERCCFHSLFLTLQTKFSERCVCHQCFAQWCCSCVSDFIRWKWSHSLNNYRIVTDFTVCWLHFSSSCVIVVFVINPSLNTFAP